MVRSNPPISQEAIAPGYFQDNKYTLYKTITIISNHLREKEFRKLLEKQLKLIKYSNVLHKIKIALFQPSST